MGDTAGKALSAGSDMKYYVDLHAVACVVETRKAIARPSGPGNPARKPARAKAEQRAHDEKHASLFRSFEQREAFCLQPMHLTQSIGTERILYVIIAQQQQQLPRACAYGAMVLLLQNIEAQLRLQSRLRPRKKKASRKMGWQP